MIPDIPDDTPFMVNVKSTSASLHIKAEPPFTKSVKVIFKATDKTEYPMWLSLNSTGYAYDKAIAIVRLFGGKANTVDEALTEFPKWRKVIRCKVVKQGRFFRIEGWVFAVKKHWGEQKGLEQFGFDGEMIDERFWGKSQRKRWLNR